FYSTNKGIVRFCGGMVTKVPPRLPPIRNDGGGTTPKVCLAAAGGRRWRRRAVACDARLSLSPWCGFPTACRRARMLRCLALYLLPATIVFAAGSEPVPAP